MKREKPVKELFALFTHEGKLFSTWENEQDAIDDATGPVFRPTCKIVRFVPDGKRPKRLKGR